MSITPINDNAVGEETPAGNAQSVNSLPASSRGRKHVPGLFILLGILLLSILLPVSVAIGYGLQAYQTYTALRDEAHSGAQDLLNIKAMFPGIKTHPAGLLDAKKLEAAQKEFVAAGKDFQRVQFTLNHSNIIPLITNYFPQYREQVSTARAASQIGIDVADIGQEVTTTVLGLVPALHAPLLNDTKAPLVSGSMLDRVGSTLDTTLLYVRDIQAQIPLLSINALAISTSQRAQFLQLVQALPQVETWMVQGQQLLSAVRWLLGVDEPRTFLVQPMDRTELRATGGFTGQYGELHINGGRVAPFALRDISLVEYVDNSPTLGRLPPEQYRSWWPFANWGLRDSNLSADFPTSARMAIYLYKQEVGHSVDGVIMFTPALIEQVLQILGPIHVPGYNETITAQNLEDRLHYYQLDNAGMLKQIVLQPGKTWTSDRKRFTAYLSLLLMDRVRHASLDEMFAIARQMLHDLKTKDLQVYFNNPQVEDLLVQYGYTAQIDRSTTHDGLYVVQENLSATKASQYVQTILHDTVTLDAAGGATHVLLLRLVYNQRGPVYGYDTYRDYVRVYVPPTSKFLWGNGFDTGTPLCGGWYAACPQNHVYPHDELVCPSGQYEPGAAPPSPIDPDGAEPLPLDTIGPPTNRISDEAGRAMFGGWVIVPKNCTMNVTLSWYVPPMRNSTYTLLIQKQAGTSPALELSIMSALSNYTLHTTTELHVNAVLDEDTFFSLNWARAFPQGHTRDRSYYGRVSQAGS